MNVRKQKAAMLKQRILNETLVLLENKSFDELFVEQICKNVKISKATLFNYFSSKEDIIRYYFRIWCFQTSVELKQKKREGLQGVYFLFEKMADTFDKHPTALLTWVACLTKENHIKKPFVVRAEEKKLLYPDFHNIEKEDIESVEMLFGRFTLEAILRGEITKSSSSDQISTLFTSIFYGFIILLNKTHEKPSRFFIRRKVDFLLRDMIT